MKARWMIAGICAAALGAPASASALDYYAADDATGTADCLSAANACTIVTALGLIDNNSDADTLNLAAGDYGEAEDTLNLSGAGFDGITIVGAGRNDTTLRQTNDAVTPFRFGGLSSTQTVRNLSLVASVNTTSPYTVSLITGALTLENVDVAGPGAKAGHRVIDAQNGSPELRLRNVHVFNRMTGLNNAQSGYTVYYSSFNGGDEGVFEATDTEIDLVDGASESYVLGIFGDADMTITRSAFRKRIEGTVPLANRGFNVAYQGAALDRTPTLKVSDTAIAGGRVGLSVLPTSFPPPNARADVTVERTSIDAGDPGVAEDGVNLPQVRGLDAYSFGAGDILNLTLRDNAFDNAVAQVGTGALNLTCENNYFAAALGSGSFIAPTNGATCSNQLTSALAIAWPDMSAVTAMDGDVRPKAALSAAFRPGSSSPLLDSATGTGAGSTDLAGSPRAVDANDADCVAQVDRGAVERQGLANVCTPGGGGGTNPPGGGGGGTTKPPILPGIPPQAALGLSKASLSPKSPTTATVGKAKLAFTLSRAGSVAVKVERQDAGKRSGKKCVKRTKKNAKAKNCKRYTRVASKTISGKAGANSVTISSVAGSKLKRVGVYRVTLTPSGGKATTVTVRVKAAKKKKK